MVLYFNFYGLLCKKCQLYQTCMRPAIKFSFGEILAGYFLQLICDINLSDLTKEIRHHMRYSIVVIANLLCVCVCVTLYLFIPF